MTRVLSEQRSGKWEGRTVFPRRFCRGTPQASLLCLRGQCARELRAGLDFVITPFHPLRATTVALGRGKKVWRPRSLASRWPGFVPYLPKLWSWVNHITTLGSRLPYQWDEGQHCFTRPRWRLWYCVRSAKCWMMPTSVSQGIARHLGSTRHGAKMLDTLSLI